MPVAKNLDKITSLELMLDFGPGQVCNAKTCHGSGGNCTSIVEIHIGSLVECEAFIPTR